jgi:hypothetical protein
MNALIKTLLITAALAGLLRGTTARAQAHADRAVGLNPFVQAAAEQLHKDNVAWNTRADATPATHLAYTVNPLVRAAEEQVCGTVEGSSEKLVDTTARIQILSMRNPFVEAAAQQLPSHNTAAEKPVPQARMMR